MPKIPFPVEIQNLPKEIEKSLFEDLIILAMVAASAHIGQSCRIGTKWIPLPVNLKAAICSKRSRNLGILFRTGKSDLQKTVPRRLYCSQGQACGKGGACRMNKKINEQS